MMLSCSFLVIVIENVPGKINVHDYDYEHEHEHEHE